VVVDGKKKTRDLPNEERAEWFKRRFRQDIATTAKKNGLALWRVHDEFTRVKGGKVTIKQGDSFAAEVARGDDVISFVDPPYVDTTGYEGYERRVGKDGAVSFEKVKPESHGVPLYRRTASLLERIRAAGHAMVYTDETFTFEKTDGDGGAAKRPDVLAQALPIYLRIARNFDRIGSVSKAIGAGRKETIGIRAGGYEDESGQQAGGGEVSDDVAAGGGRGAGLAGAAPASDGAGGGVDAAGQAAGASAEAGGGGEVVRLRLPGSVRAGDRRGEPQPEGEDRVGQVAGRVGDPRQVAGGDAAWPSLLAPAGGSGGGGQAAGRGSGGRGGGGDSDVGVSESAAGRAERESGEAQKRWSIAAGRLYGQLTAGLQEALDAAPDVDARRAVVEAWKLANPEAYAKLAEMRGESADPLQLDDFGRLIPPGEWANPETPDVRFSLMSPAVGAGDGPTLALWDAPHFRALEGREVSRPQVEQLLNKPGTKQIEKRIISSALDRVFAHGAKRVPMAEVRAAADGEILHIESRPVVKFADYGLENVFGSGWKRKMKAYSLLLGTPGTEHGYGRNHFSDYPGGAFGWARVAAEDRDGGDMYVVELQSDLFPLASHRRHNSPLPMRICLGF
jgi:hypothetical protein